MSTQLALDEIFGLESSDVKGATEALRDSAFARTQRISKALLDCREPEVTLEEWDVARADLCTSLADARAAQGIAAGIPMDDIDPATGREYSERIYAALRASWQRSYDRTVIGSLGWNLDELQKTAETHRQEFLAKRPDLDDGRPWVTA